MFVKDLFAISPQKTFDASFEEGDWQYHETRVYNAIEPNYLEFIPPGMLRRMGKAVRMGVGAGLPLIKRNGPLDGIIIGTANGGLEDCIKFLNQIVDYKEGTLTPTNFVQSTPNALAGTLGMLTVNRGYNVTHVNCSLAFENALLDAKMYFEECGNNDSSLLIGAVEEISTYNYNMDYLCGRFKHEVVSNTDLLASITDGSVNGEGANMFIVSNNPEGSLAEIVDTAQMTAKSKEHLLIVIDQLLKKNRISPDQIDLLVLGKNGDKRTDDWYTFLQSERFPKTESCYYKNAVGEYRTSSGFATYLGVQCLNGRLNNPKIISTDRAMSIHYSLIYNHFDGNRHGFILLKK